MSTNNTALPALNELPGYAASQLPEYRGQDQLLLTDLANRPEYRALVKTYRIVENERNRLRQQLAHETQSRQNEVRQLRQEKTSMQQRIQQQARRIQQLTQELAISRTEGQTLQAQLNGRPEADADIINDRLRAIETLIRAGQMIQGLGDLSSIMESSVAEDSE